MELSLSGGKYYRSKAFQEIQRAWYERLEETGFEDIEDKHGQLKTKDRRTIAWQNRERIADFFRSLDHYLNEHPEIPRLERSALELYSQGIYVIRIAQLVGRSPSWIKLVIKKYKEKLTA